MEICRKSPSLPSLTPRSRYWKDLALPVVGCVLGLACRAGAVALGSRTLPRKTCRVCVRMADETKVNEQVTYCEVTG